MANTKSAKKTIRSSARKRSVNNKIRKNYREARKAVKDAITNNDKKKASELLASAEKQIDKAAQKKVIHKNTAARYKSRLKKSVAKTS